MAAVTICSDFGAQKNKVCHSFHCFPIYLPRSDDVCFGQWRAMAGEAVGGGCVLRTYSALSAYAIDPIYISIKDVPDCACSQAQELIKGFKDDIDFWRGENKVHYKFIKSAKYKVLWAAYEHFWKNEKEKATSRYEDFLTFHQAHASWMVPYCLFRTAKDDLGWSSWKHWENNLKILDKNFLRDYTLKHYKQIMFFSYLQWQLQQQLISARESAAKCGVLLFGDIPFGVNFDSADVWANQNKYLAGYEIGRWITLL